MCSKALNCEHEGDWYGKGLKFNWLAKSSNLQLKFKDYIFAVLTFISISFTKISFISYFISYNLVKYTFNHPCQEYLIQKYKWYIGWHLR